MTLTIIILASFMVIFLSLVWVHLFSSPELERDADRLGRTRLIIEPDRGGIYDYVGRKLTGELDDYVSIIVQRSRLLNPAHLARDLAAVLGRPKEHFIEKLKHGEWVTVVRQAPRAAAERLIEMGWNLHFQPDSKRIYPYRHLASQVLGLTDIDRRGVSGIEEQFNEMLTGQPGWRVVNVDRAGRIHIKDNLPSEPAEDGRDVYLTIEIELQSILEEELTRVHANSRAVSAAGIILIPSTGEIRAMASIPTFSADDRDCPEENRKCRAITNLFEPGSTLKLIAAAALLEKGIITETDSIDTSPGYIIVSGHTIHDVRNYGILTFTQVVVKSSNVGMIKLSSGLSDEELYSSFSRFGFLGRTGVELNGEALGSMPQPSAWTGTTRPNLIIGQGISATLLQVANAYAAIANDGVLVAPTLVHGTTDPNGGLQVHEPVVLRRVVSQKTARRLTEILVQAVDSGTGKAARIEGIRCAGKTGTGQLPNLKTGGYFKDRFYASFVGFFPAEAPEYLIIIGVEDPRGAHQGGDVAAPTFARVARRLLALKPDVRDRAVRSAQEYYYKGKGKSLAKGEVDSRQIVTGPVKTPDFKLMSIRNARRIAEVSGLKITTVGKGKVVWDQCPTVGSLLEPGAKVQITLGPATTNEGRDIVVPALTQLSLRDAIQRASRLGLDIRVQGSGRVVRQLPATGAQVKPGMTLTLIANG